MARSFDMDAWNASVPGNSRASERHDRREARRGERDYQRGLREDSQEATNQLMNSAAPQGIETFYADGSDAYANKGFVVEFEHIPSTSTKDEDRNIVSFKAFISAFNETYSSEWTSETVYGRADPLYMFKNTSRTITLSLQIPAATEGESFLNLSRVQRLVQFLYPAYVNPGNAETIAQSPLVRLRIMNLIANRASVGASGAKGAEYGIEEGTGEPKQVGADVGTFDAMYKANLQNLEPEYEWNQGLLGAIQNLTVNHNVENPDTGVFEFAYGTIMPKMIEINLDFKVIHEHSIGWSNGNFSEPLFPYGLQTGEAVGNEKLIDALQASSTPASRQQRLDLRKKEEAEQQLANQRARYDGAFGAARMRRDAERAEDRRDRAYDLFGEAMEDSTSVRRAARLDARAIALLEEAQYYSDMTPLDDGLI